MKGNNEEEGSMKFIIFGTGKYYKKYRKIFSSDQIICLVDNDLKKQGCELDGKKILSPNNVDFDQCDYVIVLIKKNIEIIKQLVSLGVADEKIKSFCDLAMLLGIDIEVQRGEKVLKFSEWIVEKKEKRVLICSHELSRTGVPVAMMHMAILLKKMGWNVVIASLKGGTLESELKERSIDFISDVDIHSYNSNFIHIVAKMDFVILGTIGLSEIGRNIASSKVPVLWWLHESQDSCFKNSSLFEMSNIHYYGGGKRVVERFLEYYPNQKIEKLLYYIPAIENNYIIKDSNFTIALLGSICRRKAQDIFIQAIDMLPQEKKKNAEFVVIGKMLENWEINSILKNSLNLKYMDEMSQIELDKYYNEIDVLVCPSRDDPMPIVVTQAMQHSIPCIVSDQVGQMEYIQNNENGFVFESENVEQLSKILEYCIDNAKELPQIGKKSHKIYEDFFSERVMESNLKTIINEVLLRERNDV